MTTRRKVAISGGPLNPTIFSVGGLSLSQAIVSRPVFPPDENGLALWHHAMPVESAINVDRPLEDHAFYVLSGSFEVGEQTLTAGCVACIAKDAAATIVTRSAGTLIHYCGDAATRDAKPGGCVHLLSPEGLLSDERMAGEFRVAKVLYADSICPTCSVWLHKSSYAAGRHIPPHCHNEDEIINVLDGDLMLGARAMGVGSAVAVASGAYYSFRAGERGLTFLNFRQGDPLILIKGDDPGAWRSEGAIMRRRTGEGQSA